MEILEASPLQARCSVPLLASNTNHFGTIHAAIQWAVAETLGGIICWTNFGMDTYLGVVTQVTIDFKRPATTAIISEATISREEIDHLTRELDAEGKGNYSLEIELRDTSNQVVASASAKYHARRPEMFRNLS